MRTNVGHIYAIGDVNGLLQARPTWPPKPYRCRSDAGRPSDDAARDVLPSQTLPASEIPTRRARNEGYDVRWWPRIPVHGQLPRRTAWVTPVGSSAGDPTPSTTATGRASVATTWPSCCCRSSHAGAEVGPDRQRAGSQHFTHPTCLRALRECFHGLVGHMIRYSERLA